MFRCQLTGEVSDPAVYEYNWFQDEDYQGKRVQRRVLVKPAEKPVFLTVKTRSVEYECWFYDAEAERMVQTENSHGTEIVQEIMVRAQNLEAAKIKYRV